MNCIPWVNTAALPHKHTHTHRILKPSQACRGACAPAAQDDGEAELWRPRLLPSPSPHRIHKRTQTHMRLVLYALARFITPSRTYTSTQRVYLLSTHAQTFTQVPPGFDGWSVSALPPVSYTYNLIWGPHGGSRTKTGLIEAVKLSYPSPSQLKSYPLYSAA